MAFEPKEQNTTLFSHELRAGLSWRLFVFLLIIFSAFALSYAGLEFGYKTFLKASIDDYNKKAAAIPAKFGADQETKLIAFYSQLTNLKSLLAQHVFPSNLTAFLEASTNSNIAYTDAALDIKNSSLSLDGLADSFGSLVSQISYFETQKSVQSVTLGQNSLDKGVVRFSLKVILVPDFFNMNQTK